MIFGFDRGSNCDKSETKLLNRSDYFDKKKLQTIVEKI